MSRPARVLNWHAPTTRAQLTARFEALWTELGQVQKELLALPPEAPATPPAPLPTAWLTPAAASARYGWRADTLRYWARTGRIRSSRSVDGGRLLVSAADLDAMQAPPRAAEGR